MVVQKGKRNSWSWLEMDEFTLVLRLRDSK